MLIDPLTNTVNVLSSIIAILLVLAALYIAPTAIAVTHACSVATVEVLTLAA